MGKVLCNLEERYQDLMFRMTNKFVVNSSMTIAALLREFPAKLKIHKRTVTMALGPQATPPYEPMQEDIEPTTSCAPNSISTSLSQEQLQQFAVTQSLASEEKTSENSLGSGVGSSNKRHVNFMHNVETPEAIQTQVDYPEVSEITQYLAEKLKSNANQYAAVFYHQYNVDQKNIHEINLKQHDLQWDNSSFVRTVFSAKNIWFNYHGSIGKWAKIKRSLTDLVRHCTEGTLSENADMLMRFALSRYDSSLQRRTDLMTLTHPDIKMCFATTIPTIVQHALKLPSLLAVPIPFLKAHQNKTIYMTKKLVSSLLANAFFCTLPDEKEDMIDINFHRMFNTPARGQAKTEKLKCILNYFQQLGSPGKNPEKENQIISFERRVIHDKVNWASSSAKLTSVQVEPTKKIEEALGTLQVDFANKRVGGGVLNEGAVMEEIMFAVCPELIISRLFTETLEDDEVLIISGTEQFSNYEGYGRSFHYAGPTKPINFEVDNLGRIRTQIVVMDALHFKPHEIESQFEREKIDRELHKAFVHLLSHRRD
ncbi:Poly(ADP-ribose) glycohydrolase [Orchesella cincta]|uniref:poly(ADP-ribose) glycohydrolase n=1 Tax=Orchesella cincta TaxID=48709 RepID=A0A1D2M1I0_ORCCI|nr:Poly(ADP-ribose) glycohydrolase [Orchesella cincta]